MSWIILVDLRENNGQVVALQDDGGNIAQFDGLIECGVCADAHPMASAYPCVALDLDTLEAEYL